MDCGNVSSAKSLHGTIEFWLNPITFANGVGVIHIYESSTTDYLRSYIHPDGLIDLKIEDNDIVKVNVEATSALPLNTWSHIVWTQDGNGVKLYVNGVNKGLIGTNSGEWWTNHLSAFMTNIGCGWAYFNGLIDDVRIYNRALSADEIQALYSNSAGRYK